MKMHESHARNPVSLSNRFKFSATVSFLPIVAALEKYLNGLQGLPLISLIIAETT